MAARREAGGPRARKNFPLFLKAPHGGARGPQPFRLYGPAGEGEEMVLRERQVSTCAQLHLHEQWYSCTPVLLHACADECPPHVLACCLHGPVPKEQQQPHPRPGLGAPRGPGRAKFLSGGVCRHKCRAQSQIKSLHHFCVHCVLIAGCCFNCWGGIHSTRPTPFFF